MRHREVGRLAEVTQLTMMVWEKQAGSLHSTRLLWRTSLGRTMNTRTGELVDPMEKCLLNFSLMLDHYLSFPKGKHKLWWSFPWVYPQRERSSTKPNQLNNCLWTSYYKPGPVQLQWKPWWCCTTNATVAPSSWQDGPRACAGPSSLF